MPSLIQFVLLAAFVVALVLTLKRSKQGAISRTEMFGWSTLWIVAAIVALLPDVTTVFARFLGVGRGADAVLYISVALLFYLAFRIFLRLDKLDREITQLVRIVSTAQNAQTEKSAEDAGKVT